MISVLSENIDSGCEEDEPPSNSEEVSVSLEDYLNESGSVDEISAAVEEVSEGPILEPENKQYLEDYIEDKKESVLASASVPEETQASFGGYTLDNFNPQGEEEYIAQLNGPEREQTQSSELNNQDDVDHFIDFILSPSKIYEFDPFDVSDTDDGDDFTRRVIAYQRKMVERGDRVAINAYTVAIH